MDSGPAKIVAWLIPPACREEVLGDLSEESPGLRAILSAVLCVILSRVRRTTDPVVLLMEGLALYTAFVVIANWLAPSMMFDPAGLATLAIPPAAMLIGLMLSDAYSDPRRKSPLKPILGVVLSAAVAVAAGDAFLPRAVLMAGTGFGALVILPIRTMFPPPTERAQAARIPALWQKLELSPLSAFARQVTAGVILTLLALIAYAVYGSRH